MLAKLFAQIAHNWRTRPFFQSWFPNKPVYKPGERRPFFSSWFN